MVLYSRYSPDCRTTLVHGAVCVYRFGGGFTSWGQPFRLCHLITGKFLGIKHEGKESERLVLGEGASESLKNSNSKTLVALLNPSEASRNATAFCFVKSAVSITGRGGLA